MPDIKSPVKPSVSTLSAAAPTGSASSAPGSTTPNKLGAAKPYAGSIHTNVLEYLRARANKNYGRLFVSSIAHGVGANTPELARQVDQVLNLLAGEGKIDVYGEGIDASGKSKRYLYIRDLEHGRAGTPAVPGQQPQVPGQGKSPVPPKQPQVPGKVKPPVPLQQPQVPGQVKPPVQQQQPQVPSQQPQVPSQQPQEPQVPKPVQEPKKPTKKEKEQTDFITKKLKDILVKKGVMKPGEELPGEGKEKKPEVGKPVKEPKKPAVKKPEVTKEPGKPVKEPKKPVTPKQPKPPTKKEKEQSELEEFAKKAQEAADKAESSTGKIKLHDLYQGGKWNDLTLTKFKNKLNKAHEQGLLKLSAISPDEKLPKYVINKSRTGKGGENFHEIQQSAHVKKKEPEKPTVKKPEVKTKKPSVKKPETPKPPTKKEKEQSELKEFAKKAQEAADKAESSTGKVKLHDLYQGGKWEGLTLTRFKNKLNKAHEQGLLTLSAISPGEKLPKYVLNKNRAGGGFHEIRQSAGVKKKPEVTKEPEKPTVKKPGVTKEPKKPVVKKPEVTKVKKPEILTLEQMRDKRELETFAKRVQEVADRKAMPGGRLKIHDLYKSNRWGGYGSIPLDKFKEKLLKAHNQGLINLSPASPNDKSSKDILNMSKTGDYHEILQKRTEAGLTSSLRSLPRPKPKPIPKIPKEFNTKSTTKEYLDNIGRLKAHEMLKDTSRGSYEEVKNHYENLNSKLKDFENEVFTEKNNLMYNLKGEERKKEHDRLSELEKVIKDHQIYTYSTLHCLHKLNGVFNDNPNNPIIKEQKAKWEPEISEHFSKHFPEDAINGLASQECNVLYKTPEEIRKDGNDPDEFAGYFKTSFLFSRPSLVLRSDHDNNHERHEEVAIHEFTHGIDYLTNDGLSKWIGNLTKSQGEYVSSYAEKNDAEKLAEAVVVDKISSIFRAKTKMSKYMPLEDDPVGTLEDTAPTTHKVLKTLFKSKDNFRKCMVIFSQYSAFTMTDEEVKKAIEELSSEQ